MLATSVKSDVPTFANCVTQFAKANRVIACLFATLFVVFTLPSIGLAASVPEIDAADPVAESDPRWDAIRTQLFKDAEIQETDGVISLDAPRRAFDSARVPVSMRALAKQTPDSYIKKLHLIVDKNPLPVAATFIFEPNNGWQSIETELRINEYSNIRVVAEMNDGQLFMQRQFTKAAGGCSAPPSSYDRSDKSLLGVFEADIANLLNPSVPALAKIRLTHPNASGMQFDQMSRTYIPPHYIHTLVAEFNDKLLFTVETNFSLSQDPVLGFNFEPSENGILKLYALDSKEQRFEKSWRITASTFEPVSN